MGAEVLKIKRLSAVRVGAAVASTCERGYAMDNSRRVSYARTLPRRIWWQRLICPFHYSY